MSLQDLGSPHLPLSQEIIEYVGLEEPPIRFGISNAVRGEPARALSIVIDFSRDANAWYNTGI